MQLVTEHLNGRRPEVLCNILKEQHVVEVIDIRATTRYPVYYRPADLEGCLADVSIKYSRWAGLGNPWQLRQFAASKLAIKGISYLLPHDVIERLVELKRTKNEVVSKAAYLEYILQNEDLINKFKEHVESSEGVACLICYCNTKTDCHRFWLLEYLKNNKGDE